jgi:DNA-binding transcriptional regulator YiaG
MPDIASALKAEIFRLARKEIRTEVTGLKKASSQQRTHIAALRKQIGSLERSLKKASRAPGSSPGTSTQEAGEPSGLRFRASGLASHRQRLGVSAADFGRLLGVSGQSVYRWENGEVKPRRSQLEAIAAVRKMGRREALAKLAEAA